MSKASLSAKEIQNARLELQLLVSFSDQHLPDPSTPVAQAVHKVIQSMNNVIQTSEAKLKSIALNTSSNVGVSPSDDLRTRKKSNVQPYLLDLVNSTDLVLPLHSPTEAMALFCHSLMLSFDGIVCIAEKNGGGVTGFAAPLAPLPADTFVPAGWIKSPDNIVFNYKHKAAVGKTIKMEISKDADVGATLVKIGFKSTSRNPPDAILVSSEGQRLSEEDLSTATHPSALAQLFTDPDAIATPISLTIVLALPFLLEEQEKARKRHEEAMQNMSPLQMTRNLPPARLQQAHIQQRPPPLSSFSSRGTAGASAPASASDAASASASVGASDAHPPLPEVVAPRYFGMGPQGQLPSLYGDDEHNEYPVGGGGMLVGPEHPMFQGGGIGVFPGGGAPGFGPGLPQPRYDPVINPDIYTDPHLIGGEGTGGGLNGGRGRGRGAGRGARGVPGEPAPDHLRPPNFEDFT